MLYILLLLAIVFGVCFGVTYSALTSTKTATGVISIVMPPSMGSASTNLFIDTNNPAVYLGNDESGITISTSTYQLSKLVLVDTQSGTSAHIKIEISVLGITDKLSYNANSTTATFSDGITMTCEQTTSLITLTTSGAVSKYSYIFLDSIVANLLTSDQLTNATLQFKIYASLEEDFSNKSVSSICYNLNSSAKLNDITITLNYDYEDAHQNSGNASSFVVKAGSILSIEDNSNGKGLDLISTHNGIRTTIYLGYAQGDYVDCFYVGSYKCNGVSVNGLKLTENITIDIVWETSI